MNDDMMLKVHPGRAPDLVLDDDGGEAGRVRAPTRMEKSSARIALVGAGFIGLYVVALLRLVSFGIAPDPQIEARRNAQDEIAMARPDILDRNGAILATDVKVPSLYAEPNKLIDVDDAVEQIGRILPDINQRELREKLEARKKGFVWIKREITRDEQEKIFRLGLPGVGFFEENKRIYPNGPIVSHVMGSVNIDNHGIAGIEKFIDTKRGLADLQALGYTAQSQDLRPVRLSIDLRTQAAVRDELIAGMAHFRAKAAAAAVMDVNTGEMISLVSLPDFDPNNPAEALDPNRINRINVGVFEMGSTFKAMTMAMGIDSGKYSTASMLDARSGALSSGGFTIHDYHAQRRMLSLVDVYRYSSNVGTARIALGLGVDAHKAFLKKMGQLDRLVTELPENAAPLVPARWRELSTITISYGHGIAVAPLQALMGVGAMMNGGHLITPTFLMRDEATALAGSTAVLKPHTSDVMRYLMRMNVEIGSAKKADIPGLQIGAKTGTAEKVVNGRYSKDKTFTTFMAVLPFDKPKYVVVVLYDEPQALPETYGYTTAAWNAGVTTGKVLERIAPLLGVQPRFYSVPNPVPPLYSARTRTASLTD